MSQRELQSICRIYSEQELNPTLRFWIVLTLPDPEGWVPIPGLKSLLLDKSCKVKKKA